MIERQICNQLGIVKIEIKIYGVKRSENITNVFIQSFQFPDFEIFLSLKYLLTLLFKVLKKSLESFRLNNIAFGSFKIVKIYKKVNIS